MSLENELRDIVRKKMVNKETEIRPEMTFADIGLDSLDIVEIVFDIEDKYKIVLSKNNEEMGTATFRDLVAIVERQIQAAKTAPAAG
jgi:acyl carrier protein